MPERLMIGEAGTLVIGLVALFIGMRVRKAVPLLKRLDLPYAVIGAVIVAVAVLVIHLVFRVEVVFADRLRDLLLLIFFTTIGLSAKLGALRQGGKPLLILCSVTVLLLVLQNMAGTAIALIWGAHPFYGLIAGSLSFVGGPGTALAWAREGQAMGLAASPLVAIGAATMAALAGALVSGPITGRIIRHHNLHGAAAPETAVPFVIPHPDTPPPSDTDGLERLLSTILVIAAAVFIGDTINSLARSAGLLLPGFLCAMLAGVLITNLADVFRYKLDFAPIEKGGEIALHMFLVIALMGAQLAAMGSIVTPLLANLLLQLLLTTAVAYFILFRLLGRDYDAAVTVGGFLGFGISSMPVAMATMDEVAKRYGPSAKAFLLITLAGSFFVDLANAFVAKAFLSLPLYAVP